MFAQTSRKTTSLGGPDSRATSGNRSRAQEGPPRRALPSKAPINPVWQALSWRAPAGAGAPLQRKCACGGGASGPGSCAACSGGSAQAASEDDLLSGAGRPAIAPLQRKHAPHDAAADPEGDLHRHVEGALRSGGEPLPREARADLEPRFGHDLGHVRVHSGETAAAAAAAVQARAFTVGEHIVWGGGQGAAFSRESRGLLAHEVTHTLQQGSRAGYAVPAAGISRPSDPAEQQADSMEQAVSQPGSAARSAGAPGGALRPVAAPAHVARAPLPSDKEINGLFWDRASSPNTIFFDRGSSALDPAEEAKIAAAAAAFSGKNIELHGYRSEEEAASLATDRINAVEGKLSGKHTGAGTGTARDPKPKPAASAGQIDYREWRKVDIVAAGKPPPTGSCAGVPLTKACAGGDETAFQTLAGGAEWMASQSASQLASPTAAINALLDKYFGAGVSGAGSAHASTIAGNFKEMAGHIGHLKGTPAHVCGTPCNPQCAAADAFNLGVGKAPPSTGSAPGGSQMTLCPTFFKGSTPGLQIAIIMHEAAHGTAGLKNPGGATRTFGLQDFSYVAERLYPVLPPAQAVINSDTYVWFAAALLKPPTFTGGKGIPPTPQPVAAADTLDPSIASSNDVKLAVGRAQKWLRWCQQNTASLYTAAGTAMDKGSWTHPDVPGFGKPLMDRVAPASRFDLTLTTSAPTQADRTALAAIQDRYFRMAARFNSTLTVKDGRPGTAATTWAGTTLTLGTDFFALPGGSDAQALLVIRKLVEATSGISSGVQSAYVDFADEAQKDVT